MVSRVPEVLGTADKTIRLAPQYLLDDLPRLAARLDRAPDELAAGEPASSALQLILSTQHRTLMNGPCRSTLLMHTDDAVKHSVVAGNIVAVTSAGGRVAVPVEVTAAIMPGVVWDPATAGVTANAGTRMSVANDSPRREHQRAVPAELHRRAVGQRVTRRRPR